MQFDSITLDELTDELSLECLQSKLVNEINHQKYFLDCKYLEESSKVNIRHRIAGLEDKQRSLQDDYKNGKKYRWGLNILHNKITITKNTTFYVSVSELAEALRNFLESYCQTNDLNFFDLGKNVVIKIIQHT